jgi:hypothetical protein
MQDEVRELLVDQLKDAYSAEKQGGRRCFRRWSTSPLPGPAAAVAAT